MPHFMIVTSPYYAQISSFLLEGATSYLTEKKSTFEVVEVPGALELPLAVKLGISRPQTRGTDFPHFDGYIALGCVIRGETSHYDIVCNESARGLSELALEYNAPIGNAILTCENKEQAIVRADPAQKNKGRDAAQAAYRMFELKRDFKVTD